MPKSYDSELSRLVRKGTEGQRIMKNLEVVAYVGLNIDRWERNGLVTTEEKQRFWEAGLEAGAQLGTSFLPATRNEAGLRAKREEGRGYGTGQAGAQPGARNPGADEAKRAALRRRDGYRAAARRAGGDHARGDGGLQPQGNRDGHGEGEG